MTSATILCYPPGDLCSELPSELERTQVSGHCHSVSFQIPTELVPRSVSSRSAAAKGREPFTSFAFPVNYRPMWLLSLFSAIRAVAAPDREGNSTSPSLSTTLSPAPALWHSKCWIQGQKTSAAFLGS